MRDLSLAYGGALFCALLLGACASNDAWNSDAPNFLGTGAGNLTAGKPDEQARGPIAGAAADARRGFAELAAGGVRRGAVAGRSAELSDDGRSVNLNFVDADVQEFVRVVFDEVLKESAIVDPTLEGKVTLRTVQPISRTAAIDLVRNVLEMNGANLTRSGSVYRIRKIESGRKSGGAVRAIPVSHIDPEQAKAAVQAVAGDGTELFASKGGRFLLASGAAADLDAVEQAVSSLDVDQMTGMSFALMPLREASAQAVATELSQMFGQSASLKALPIQRMNAVLIVSRTAASVERARNWIRKLDQGGHDGRRVFVYAVQNRRARDIAQVLNAMIGKSAADAPTTSERRDSPVAPTVKPAAASTDGFANPPVDQLFEGASGATDQAELNRGGAGGFAESGAGRLTKSDVAVSADLSTNSLVIIAKPDDYQLVKAAIRRLDVQPAQVLIEATIFEVQLNDTLRHGVRWYFEHGDHGALLTEGGKSIGGADAGFNYIFQAPKAKVVMNALESMTKLEVISSPALTVLDNQTATLKVGDQVPIATRSAQDVTTRNAPLVNDIEMKDTGIILSVTPRVNAGGLVQLDIAQEVSDVVKTTSSGINSPTIRQRSVNSSVAVHSGSEIVLGGLISRRKEEGRAGLPVLKDIPVLGEAFTTNALKDNRRNELLIIIRPVVMANKTDVYAVTQEIRSRMSGISRLQSKPISTKY